MFEELRSRLPFIQPRLCLPGKTLPGGGLGALLPLQASYSALLPCENEEKRGVSCRFADSRPYSHSKWRSLSNAFMKKIIYLKKFW